MLINEALAILADDVRKHVSDGAYDKERLAISVAQALSFALAIEYTVVPGRFGGFVVVKKG